jgi:hypothetical protein
MWEALIVPFRFLSEKIFMKQKFPRAPRDAKNVFTIFRNHAQRCTKTGLTHHRLTRTMRSPVLTCSWS